MKASQVSHSIIPHGLPRRVEEHAYPAERVLTKTAFLLPNSQSENTVKPTNLTLGEMIKVLDERLGHNAVAPKRPRFEELA